MARASAGPPGLSRTPGCGTGTRGQPGTAAAGAGEAIGRLRSGTVLNRRSDSDRKHLGAETARLTFKRRCRRGDPQARRPEGCPQYGLFCRITLGYLCSAFSFKGAPLSGGREYAACQGPPICGSCVRIVCAGRTVGANRWGEPSGRGGVPVRASVCRARENGGLGAARRGLRAAVPGGVAVCMPGLPSLWLTLWLPLSLSL